MYYVKQNQMRLAKQAGSTYLKRSKYEDVRKKLSSEEPAMNGVETMPYESVLRVFEKLKLSEENKKKIIKFGMELVDRYDFENESKNSKDYIYAKLGAANYMIGKDKMAGVFFGYSKEIPQDETIKAVYNEFVAEMRIKNARKSEIQEQKNSYDFDMKGRDHQFVSLYHTFSELKLSEENAERIIELGLNFVDDFRIYYFCKNDEVVYYNVYARLGIAYYMCDDYENAVKYLEGNKRVLDYVNGKKVSFENYIEKEAAFVCKIASTMLQNKGEEVMVEEMGSLKKALIDFENKIEALNQPTKNVRQPKELPEDKSKELVELWNRPMEDYPMEM